MKSVGRVFFLFFATAVLGAFTGFLIGVFAQSYDLKSQAIEAGVAEYRVNPKTGETSFHFITREAKP